MRCFRVTATFAAVVVRGLAGADDPTFDACTVHYSDDSVSVLGLLIACIVVWPGR